MPWNTDFPREEVKWHPTIEKNKCVKCGMYMNCGKNVYDWTEDKPIVARSYQCVVGCSTCANLCQGRAITFQDIDDIREIYKKKKIWIK